MVGPRDLGEQVELEETGRPAPEDVSDLRPVVVRVHEQTEGGLWDLRGKTSVSRLDLWVRCKVCTTKFFVVPRFIFHETCPRCESFEWWRSPAS